MKILSVSTVPPQPWRNGGGQTRELITWPEDGDWQLRVSRADIDADGPFSIFSGTQRWFTVISGDGVTLTGKDFERSLNSSDQPLRFDGGLAPFCRLINGPTQDLNLMARGGTSVMRKVTII